MIRRLVVLALGGIGCLAAASSASAAQFPLGQDTGTDFGCGGAGYSELQASTAGSPGYAAPADGTITSWSFGTNADTDDVVKLRVFRPTADPDQFQVVGDSAPQGPLPPNTVNGPFQTSIPVKAGDVLGVNIVEGSGPMCLFATSAAGDLAKEVNPDNYNVGDVANTTDDFTSARVNMAATLSTPEPPTGQRAAALKQCKKKAKKKHWTKKRLKKCKRKARLLPV
jgi:hypothetical protein